MKVVGLVSGGKDSTYNLMKCLQHNHEIICLANLRPGQPEVDELDSWMYQSVGHEAIEFLAECMQVPLIRIDTEGKSVQQTLNYDDTALDTSDEVETLYYLLRKAKQMFPQLEAVSCGAILSNYQRFRVETVCARLGLKSLCYLWQRDQKELLSEMVSNGMDAILIKVAGYGLFPKIHLGKTLKELEPELNRLNQQCEINVCGEGGEYETLTLDCPLFKSKLIIKESEIIVQSENAYDSVGYLKIKKIELQPKTSKFLTQLDIPRAISGFPSASNCQNKSFCSHIYYVQNEDEKRDPFKTTSKFKKSTQNTNAPMSRYGQVSLQLTDANRNRSIKEQIVEQMAKIEDQLDQIYYVQLFVKDMKDFNIVNDIYCEYFSYDPPSRTCVQVPFADGQDVAISVQTFNRNEISRTVLHVSSISEWAPACIGPYSQGNETDQIIHMAGQIALIPGTMELLRASPQEEIQLILKNTEACLRAMSSSLSRVFSCNVFVTDLTLVAHISKELKASFHPQATIFYLQVPVLPRFASIEIQPRAYHKSLDAEKLRCIQTDELSSTIGFEDHIGYTSTSIPTKLGEPSQWIERIAYEPATVFFHSTKAQNPKKYFPNSCCIPVENIQDDAIFLLQATKEIVE